MLQSQTDLSRRNDLADLIAPERSIAVHAIELSPDLMTSVQTYLTQGPKLIVAKGDSLTIQHLLEETSLENTPLLADILDQIGLYTRITTHHAVRVRLEKITSDSCRKFHVDCVNLRLLRTYAGPGVQWTQDEGATIHTTPTGAVVLLKGKHFPGWNTTEPVKHRSPPLSGLPPERRLRLLLTLDDIGACGAQTHSPLIVEA